MKKVWAPNFEQKIHRIISYINSYRSPSPDSRKSSIHSFRPKNSFHTFSYFFILIHNLFHTSIHTFRNPCCFALFDLLFCKLRARNSCTEKVQVPFKFFVRVYSSTNLNCAFAQLVAAAAVTRPGRHSGIDSRSTDPSVVVSPKH